MDTLLISVTTCKTANHNISKTSNICLEIDDVQS